MEMLILVDEKDGEIGFAPKEETHVWPAKLHRAFSIFIFNSKGEMLIHKRASMKKTWPGFWTNACCSHPRKGEATAEAAARRLKEELGFSCELKEMFAFPYKAQYDEHYGENEFDHVFIGHYDGPVKPDKGEVEEWKFVAIRDLITHVAVHPEIYTPWFRACFERVLEVMGNK